MQGEPRRLKSEKEVKRLNIKLLRRRIEYLENLEHKPNIADQEIRALYWVINKVESEE